MSKKRKEAAQSTTLFDFFGNSANKKPKTQCRAKKSPVKHERFSVAPADIIVIDSDDENEANAKTKSTGASSDVEIIDYVEKPPQRTRTSFPSTKGATPSTHNGKHSFGQSKIFRPSYSQELAEDSFGKPSSLLAPPEPPELTNSFGTPTLLLPDRSPRKHGLNDIYPTAGSKEGPGIPAECSVPTSPMLQASSSNVGRRHCVAASPHPSGISTEIITQDIIEISDDDWGTGDDEMAFMEAELNLDGDNSTLRPDIDLTLDSDDLSDNGEAQNGSCPICSLVFSTLSGDEIQEHVNTCLNNGPENQYMEDTAPARPLRTPSSLHASSIETLSSSEIDNTRVHVGGSNAFSTIMNGYKENQAWKEASIAEDRNFRPTKGNGGRRKAPFYKILTGMPIAVDAFRYGTIPEVTAYFLTHAHSDHYTNLSEKWKNGPIYCSEDTANLIKHMLGVDPKWVYPLPMDVPTVIPSTGGVQVTPIEANHCPGSCIFLFEGKQTVDAGDSAYKASPQHVLYPAIRGKKIDCVYLDTTYLDPRYCFPPQPQVITACAELARRLVSGSPIQKGGNGKMTGWFFRKEDPGEKAASSQGKTLVVVGTYSIGKERIVKAIAEALQTKVYCDPRKTAILRCQSDPELHCLLTSNPLEAGVHLVPLGVIASDKLKIYMERWKGHFSKAVGFRPTGWTFSSGNGTDTLPSIASVISRSQQRTFTYSNLAPMRNSTTNLQVYGVPYSEHSSFFELTCFALSFDWGRMIATVNVGSEASRGKMAKWVAKWEAERRRRGKVEVVSYRASDYW